MKLHTASDVGSEELRFIKQLSRTGGDWVSWSPTLTASTVNPTIGNSTRSGLYTVILGVCLCFANIQFGNTWAAGTGVYRMTLPVFPLDINDFYLVGNGFFHDISAFTSYSIHAQRPPESVLSGGNVEFYYHGGNALTNVAPVVPAVDDALRVQFMYPVS